MGAVGETSIWQYKLKGDASYYLILGCEEKHKFWQYEVDLNCCVRSLNVKIKQQDTAVHPYKYQIIHINRKFKL